MTVVVLDVKQVKFVVFLCLIRTTETQPVLANLYSVFIGLQSESRSAFHPVTTRWTTETILETSF